jgi:hypothetical protein
MEMLPSLPTGRLAPLGWALLGLGTLLLVFTGPWGKKFAPGE